MPLRGLNPGFTRRLAFSMPRRRFNPGLLVSWPNPCLSDDEIQYLLVAGHNSCLVDDLIWYFPVAWHNPCLRED